ncbi:hypothetical protein GF415_01285 [Candidatus Micrarchaeota archaeon]|nr:hypothetical protein [Candidatus Micrarchaeota archaeon]
MVRNKIEKKPEKNDRESFPPVPGKQKKSIPPKLQQKLNMNLLLAAQAGQWGRAGRLLEEGAAPEETDGCSYSALTYASAAGESGLVSGMLEEGEFDIDKPQNYAAIMLAHREGHHEIVGLLGEHMKEKNDLSEFYAKAIKEHTLFLIRNRGG